MTPKELHAAKDTIALSALNHAAFDGWSWETALAAAQECDFDAQTLQAMFPEKLADLSDHVALMADRWMMEALEETNPDELRIRDRIRTAVLARYEGLNPHKDAMAQIMTYWAMPFRQARAGKILWRTADTIWDWAGDTATDYNRYTKRGLLSSILAATTLAWLTDEDPDMVMTKEFLDRRIDNVMVIGGLLGKVKKKAAS